MRGLAVLFAVLVMAGFATEVSAGAKIRLAQSSATTTCMMTCNSQAATCQAACFVPSAPPVGSTTSTFTLAQTPGPNVTASTTCVMNCTTTQVSCQTTCARTSPSQ